MTRLGQTTLTVFYSRGEERMNTENKSFTPVNIRDLWQTPKEIFNKLDDEFQFDCDVAASDQNYLCEKYFTDSELNGAFDNDWGRMNWCNPPYSNITPWVQEVIWWYQNRGKGTVMLVPADTSVKWFKLAYESCDEVRLISGRISFINLATQKPVNGNNKGSVLFVWNALPNTSNNQKVSLINRDDFYRGE